MLVCLIALAAFLSLVMACAALIATRTGNSGFIDVSWSFAIGLAAIAGALWPLGVGDYAPRRWMVAGLAFLWALRLGLYILTRSFRHGDDPRYAALKAEWGERASLKLFQFLQIQAVAGWPLVGAGLIAAHAPFPSFRLCDALAVVLFAGALIGETAADRQMAAFRSNPRNKGGVCDIGLWRWSRHPNYFFEWLSWCAYPIVAINISGAYPWGWVSLAAPVVMYVLLAHVSGVPPLEEHMRRTRPEAFAIYARKTPAFWPWPPGRL